MGNLGYLINLREIVNKDSSKKYYIIDYILESEKGYVPHTDFVSAEVFKKIADKNIKFLTQKVQVIFNLNDNLKAYLVDMK